MIKSNIARLIWFCFASLAIVTPILFTTATSELFEVPKMLFVYLVAVILTTLTLVKFVIAKELIIPKNLILATLVVILSVSIASTAGSIDRFTSIFGYPSRLNGGLLSQIAYTLIFFSALVNLDKVKSAKIILIIIATALAVSLWGIPSYFGRDPNCLVLTGKLTSTCWQQEFDPTKRIFSTLGQPNWLASYLVLVLPLAISQIFLTKIPSRKILFLLSSLVIFIAALLTNSRAGLAGLLISTLLFLALMGAGRIKKNLKILLALFLPIAIIATVAGSTMISRISEVLNPPQQPQAGTESGQIRLIVWQGALSIFKNNPLLGTGPETFPYAYYQHRPTAHNKTTEWNFFYNKAHNEFLNYLANLGILGLGSYGAFLTLTILALWKVRQFPTAIGALAAIVGYQLTILFGFSVVVTQTIMFLVISSALSGTQNTIRINLQSLRTSHQLLISGLIFLVGIFFTANVARLFTADVLITRAKLMADDDPGTLKAYGAAISTFPVTNPFYLADAANAISIYQSPQLANYSASLAAKARNLSPNNLLTLRKVANTYLILSQTDESYEPDAIAAGIRLTELAPTDPQSYLTLAKIQIGLDRNQEARASLKKALELKPDYLEAQQILEQLTINN